MFDLTKDYGDSGFEPIPEGYYPMVVSQVDWKQSKAGSNYMEITFTIAGERYANRKVFHRLNLEHDREVVRNIALSDIKKMLIASRKDITKLSGVNKEQLNSIVYTCEVEGRVVIEKSADPAYPDKNVIKGWRPLSKELPSFANSPTDNFKPTQATFDTNDIPF